MALKFFSRQKRVSVKMDHEGSMPLSFRENSESTWELMHFTMLLI